MSDRQIPMGSSDRADKQLAEALENSWFRGLILSVFAVVVPVLTGFVLSLWQWPVLVAVSLFAWLFGVWYGRFTVASRIRESCKRSYLFLTARTTPSACWVTIVRREIRGSNTRSPVATTTAIAAIVARHTTCPRDACML